MNLQEFLLSINGYATLLASDGTFLGVVSSNQYDLNSISNPHGQYGSPHGLYSVRNQYSMYGGSYGIYSPYNSNCLQPPVIVYNGKVVLIVTRNTNLSGIGVSSSAYGWIQGVPLVDPDFLFSVYGCLGSTSATTQFQGGFIPVSPQPYPITGIPSYSQAQGPINNAEALFLQGNELINSHRYEEAISAYNQAVQIQPNFPDAWNNGGLALTSLQRYQEAITSFERAIQIQPDFAEAWYLRGNGLLNLRSYEEAITSYDRVIQNKPDFVEAWYNRGIALLNLQRNEDAFVAFDRAIQLKSDFYDAWCNRGLALFNLKHYEEAVASFDRMIQLKPDIAEVWLLRGSALGELKRYAEALICCDRAIQLKPDLLECWSVRGIVFAKLQQYEEAIAACDHLIQQKPDSPLGWYSKACCYVLQGNIELGIKNLKWTVELDSKYKEIAKTDSSFDCIRENERFQQLIDG